MNHRTVFRRGPVGEGNRGAGALQQRLGDEEAKPHALVLAGLAGVLLLASIASGAAPSAAGPFAGRWALTLPNGAAGWLEVADRGGWLDGAILWGGGSVLPAAHVHVHDGVLTLTVPLRESAKPRRITVG